MNETSLPGMIDNATRPELKEALRNHLAVTMTHRDRLDAIKNVVIDENDEEDEGFFSALFGGSNEVKSAGIDGLIKEAKKIMDEDPGVAAGVFVYELHPCRGFPGDSLPK